jgi:hypothetical protein
MDDDALIRFVQIKQPEILQLHNGQGNVIRKLNAGELCRVSLSFPQAVCLVERAYF